MKEIDLILQNLQKEIAKSVGETTAKGIADLEIAQEVQLRKAEEFFGKQHKLHGTKTGEFKVTNTHDNYMRKLERENPEAYGHVTSGVSSHVKSVGFQERVDRSSLPELKMEELGKINQQLNSLQNKVERVEYSKQDTKKLAGNKEYAAIDFETIGVKGQKSFAPTQMAIMQLGDKGKGQLPQEYFFRLNSETEAYIKTAIDKATGSHELTADERRSLLWLRDIKESADGKTLMASHERITKDMQVQDYIKEIQRGYELLKSNKNYANVRDYTKEEMAKILTDNGMLTTVQKGKTTHYQAGKVKALGHNIGNFDLEIFRQLGLPYDTDFFDTLSFARDYYKIGEKRVSKIKDSKGIETAVTKRLLGYKNENLIDFFNLDMEKIAQEVYGEKAKSKDFISKLQHTAAYDTLITKGVLEAFQQDFGTSAKAQKQMEKVAKGFKVGQIGIADKGLFRRNQNDFKVGSDGKIKSGEGLYNQYDHQLFRRGSAYKLEGIKELSNGQGYYAEFLDVEHGDKVKMSAKDWQTLEADMKRVFVSGGMTEKSFNKTYNTQAKATNELFNSFFNLKRGIQIHTGEAKATSSTQKGRQQLVQEFLGKNAGILGDVIKQIEQAGLSDHGKDLVVKHLGEQLGAVSIKGMNGTQIGDYILRGAGKGINNAVAKYQEFLGYLQTGGDASFKKEIGDIMSAVSSIGNMYTDATYAEGASEFALVNDWIRDMITARGVKSNVYKNVSLKNPTEVMAQLEQGISLVRSSMASEGQKVAERLYEVASKDSHLSKALDGRSTVSRYKNDKLKFKDNDLTKTSGTSSGSFSPGTVGSYLTEIEEHLGKNGYSLIAQPNGDGTNLKMGIIKTSDIGQAQYIKGNQIHYDWNKMATLDIPLATEQGVFNDNGMLKANMLTPKVIGRGQGNSPIFVWETAQEQIMRTIKNIVASPNASQGKHTFMDLLASGDYAGAQAKLTYAKRMGMENLGAIATYKEQNEATQTIDLSRRSAEEQLIRTHTMSLFDTYKELYNSIHGTSVNDDVLSKLTDSEGRNISTDVMNTMHKLLVMANHNMEDFYAMDNNDSVAKYLGGKDSLLSQAIIGLAKSMPYIQLSGVKEVPFASGYRVNFMGPQLMSVGADLTSEEKRANAQVYHYLENTTRSQEEIKKLNATLLGKKQKELKKFNATLPEYSQGRIFGGQAHIVSGHGFQNDVNKPSNLQYDIGLTDDLQIYERITSKLAELKQSGITEANKGLYNELRQVQNSFSMPSVYNGTVLVSETVSKLLESKRHVPKRVKEGMEITDELLKTFGMTRSQLMQMGEGQRIELKNGTFTVGAEGLLAATMGENAGRHDKIQLKEGDVLNSIFRDNQGNFVIDYDELVQAKTGTRGLAENYERLTYRVISDQLMSVLNGGNSNIGFLKEDSKMKTASVNEYVAGKYNYIFDLALRNGFSMEQIGKAVAKSGGVASRYFTYDAKNKQLVSKAVRQLEDNGMSSYVGANGELLARSIDEWTNFLNDRIFEETEQNGKKVRTTKVNKDSDVYKILEGIDPSGDLLKIYKKNPNVIRQAMRLGDETDYKRGMGFEQQGLVEKDAPFKIGIKEKKALERTISAAEGTYRTQEGKEYSEGKALLNNGMFEELRNALDFFTRDLSASTMYYDKTTKSYKIDKRLGNSATEALKTFDILHNTIQGNLKLSDNIDYKNTDFRNQVLNSNETLRLVTQQQFDALTPEQQAHAMIIDGSKGIIKSLGSGKGGKVTSEAYANSTYGLVLEAFKSGGYKNVMLDLQGTDKVISAIDGKGTATNLSQFLLPMLDPSKLKEGIMPHGYEKMVHSLLEGVQNGSSSEQLSATAMELLTTMGNSIYHKEGSVYQALNKLPLNNSGVAVMRGRNMMAYAKEAEEQGKLLSQMVKGQQAESPMENTLVATTDLLKEMLAINKEGLSKSQYTKAFNNLKYTYQSVGGKLSALGENYTEDKLIQGIIDRVDIRNSDFNLSKQFVDAVGLRFPSIEGQDMRFVKMVVDSKAQDNHVVSFTPGGDYQINADFDADKMFLSLLGMTPMYANKENFMKVREQIGAVRKLQTQSLSKNAGVVLEDYFGALNNKNEEFATATKNVAKFLMNPNIPDTITTLVAKTYFGQVGRFSNKATGVRQVLDDLGMGEFSADGANRVQNLKDGSNIRAFFEFMEQEPISAKKIADRLSTVMGDSSGQSVEELKKQISADKIFTNIDRLYGALTTPYQGSKKGNFSNVLNQEGYWNNVFTVLNDMGYIKTDDNGRAYFDTRQNATHAHETASYIQGGSGNSKILYIDELKQSLLRADKMAGDKNLGNLMSAASSTKYSWGTKELSAESDSLLYWLGQLSGNASMTKVATMFEALKPFVEAQTGKLDNLSNGGRSGLLGKSFYTELIDPDGAHKYIKYNEDGTIASTTNKTGEMYSATTIAKMLSRSDFTPKIKNEGQKLASYQISAIQNGNVDFIKENQQSYMTDLTAKEQKAYQKYIDSFYFKHRKGTLQHKILELMNWSTLDLSNEADISKRFEEAFASQEFQQQFNKYNSDLNTMMSKQLFTKNIFEQYTKTFLQGQGLMKAKGLSVNTPLFVEMMLGSNLNGVDVVGTADIVTATGIEDYKFKDSAPTGIDETLQLNINNRLMLDNILEEKRLQQEKGDSKFHSLWAQKYFGGENINPEALKKWQELSNEENLIKRATNADLYIHRVANIKGLEVYEKLKVQQLPKEFLDAQMPLINEGNTYQLQENYEKWIADQGISRLFNMNPEWLSDEFGNVIEPKLKKELEATPWNFLKNSEQLSQWLLRNLTVAEGENGQKTFVDKNKVLSEVVKSDHVWDLLAQQMGQDAKALKATIMNPKAKNVTALIKNKFLNLLFGEQTGVSVSEVISEEVYDKISQGIASEEEVVRARVEKNIDNVLFKQLSGASNLPEGQKPMEQLGLFDANGQQIELSEEHSKILQQFATENSINVLETFNKLKGAMKPEEWKSFAESITTITHTHPNGNGLPSKEDLETIRTMVESGDYKNLKFLRIAGGKDFLGVTMTLDNVKDWDSFIEKYSEEVLNETEEEKRLEKAKGFFKENSNISSIKNMANPREIANPYYYQNMVETLAKMGQTYMSNELATDLGADSKMVQSFNEAYKLEQKLEGAKKVATTKSSNIEKLSGEIEEIGKISQALKLFEQQRQGTISKVKLGSELSNLGVGGSEIPKDLTAMSFSSWKDWSANFENQLKERQNQLLGTQSQEEAIVTRENQVALDQTALTHINKNIEELSGSFDKAKKGVDSYGETMFKEQQAGLKRAQLFNSQQQAFKDFQASRGVREGSSFTKEEAEAYKRLMGDKDKGPSETGSLQKFKDSYKQVTGIELKDTQAINMLEKLDKDTQRAKEEDRNHTLKEGVSQFQLLQKMLNSNAPTKFTDSLANSLNGIAKKLGKDGDIQDGMRQIAEKMSQEQRLEYLMQQNQQFNNSLAQARALDAKAYQLEQATTNYNRVGADTEKTSIVNPWQSKMMTAQKTAIGLEQAKVQADLHKQMSQAGDSTTKAEYQDRIKLNEQLMETNRQFLDTQRNAIKGSLGVQKLAHSFKGMLHTAFQYGVVYRGAQALIQQIFTVVQSIKEFDAVETQLRMLKNVNKDTAASMIKDYRKIADEYGIMTAEVANAAVTFLRQGKNAADTNTLIRQSAILAKVGFMEQTEAAELLTATLNGFKLEAKDAASVIDLVSYTDQIAATSAQELMTAFQYVASSASVAGIEVEKLNAMIATSSETTRLSASTIGQAYKTMVSRLQQVKVGSLVDEESGEDLSNVDKMLKQYGIDIMDINGKMKDGDVILEEFAKKWASWGNDTAKKREAIEALAGTRQGNIAMSLFDNWDRYEEILEDSTMNSSGSSAEKMEKNSESISTSIARLQNALRSIMSSDKATGLYKWIVDLTTGLVKMSPVILTVAGAFLLLKGNGSGLNAVYNIQTGLVEKLKSSYMSLAHAQEYQQMQAQKALIAGNMKTISGGGMTAFIDPTTGAPGEVMDNGVASRTLAYQSVGNLQHVAQKYNLPVNVPKNFDWNSMVEGQIDIQRARLSGQLSTVALSGSDYVTNLNGILGSQFLKGNLSAPDLKNIIDSIGSMSAMGYSQEEISRGINNKLFTKKSDGSIMVNENLASNADQFRQAKTDYIKTNPDSEAAKAMNLVEVGNNLSAKIQELIGALDRNTNAQTGEVENSTTPNGNKQGDTQQNSVSNTKEELLGPNPEYLEDFDKETREAVALSEGEDNSEYLKEREKKRNQLIEKNRGIGTYDIGNEKLILPVSPKTNWLTQRDSWQKYQQFYQKHQQGVTIGTGMIGMIGGSMGATAIGQSLGMDSSSASMLGMGAGMGLQMLSATGPVGAGIAAVGGVALGVISLIKNGIEKVKENQRKVFSEAEEAFKNIKNTLNEIEDIDFKTTFEDLSQGVDENGRNVSLTDEEYEQYQEAVNKLTEAVPSLIKAYDAEGNALIDRNSLLNKSIELLKQENEENRKKMYGDSGVNETKIDDINKSFQEKYGNQDNWFTKWWNNWIDREGYEIAGANNYEDYLNNAKSNSWKEQLNFLLGGGLKSSAHLWESMQHIGDPEWFEENSTDTYWQLTEEEWQKQKEIYEKKKKEQNESLANYYQNVISVDDTYKTFGEGTQQALNDYIKSLDFTSKELDDYTEVEKVLEDLVLKVKKNEELQQALNQYSQRSENVTAEELAVYREQVLTALKNDGYSNVEAIQMAKELGVVEKSSIVANIEQAGSYNGAIEGIQEKIAQSGLEVEKNYAEDLAKMSQKELEELNNNWNSIVFNEITDGFVDIEKSFDKWKKHVDDSFKEKINITSITKYTEGVDSLMSAVKSYKETLYTDEKGQKQYTLTPEAYNQILKIQEAYGLSEEQMSYALENEANGDWELLGDNVDRLAQVMLENTFRNRESYTAQELRMLDANFRSQGILGAKEMGYNEFLRKMATEGYIGFSETGDITLTNKKMTGEQKELYEIIINDSGFMGKKYDSTYVQTSAQLSTAENALNYLRKEGELTKYIDKVSEEVPNSQKINQWLEDQGGISVDLADSSFEALTESVKKVTDSLGGFNSVITSVANSTLFTTQQKKTIGLMTGTEKMSLTELQNYVGEAIGKDLSEASAQDIYAILASGREQKINELQYRYDHYDDVNSTDALKVGQAEEEYRQAQRSVRDLRQQLEDLNKEQQLEDFTLIVDKLQLSLDKLNKTISTLGSTMDILDSSDFGGKFENIAEQIRTSDTVLQESKVNWDTLNAEYEKAAESGNGELMQKIGEQMSAYNDNITEHSIKTMQLKKQAAELIVEKATAEIEQIGSVVDRELKILDMQRSELDPTKINLVNTDLFTNPLDFLPVMRVSEVEKTRKETNAILTEEQKRQERINEIKEASLQVIYEEAKERRKQDIADAQEDLNTALTKLEQAWYNKQDAMTTYSREAIGQLIRDLNQMWKDSGTWEKEVILKVSTEEESQMNAKQYATSKGLRLDENGVVTGVDADKGYTDDEKWRLITDYVKRRMAEGGDIVSLEGVRHSSAENLGLSTTGYDGLDMSHDNNEYRQYLGYDFIKNKRTGKVKDGADTLDSYAGELYIVDSGNNLLRVEKSSDGTWTAYDQNGKSKQTWKTTEELWSSSKDIYTNKYQSNAYATPDTPISSGPITVGEKAPEFVMFKDGTGAIFDKTTILNGAEVDFVSDASYATGGKSNGTFVEGSYANGGNLSGAKETAKEIQQEVSENNKTIVENVETTNEEIEKNVVDNNKKVSEDIKTTAQNNEKTVRDSLKAVQDTTKKELDKVVSNFVEAMEEIRGKTEDTGFINPIDEKNIIQITDKYGNRIHPITGKKGLHDGIDIAAAKGTEVKSVKGGTVTYAGWNEAYGNIVKVDHGDGKLTFYAHLSEIKVKEGDKVSQGTLVGLVGSTGWSTGDHLHFGASDNGRSINPSEFMQGYKYHDSGTIHKDFSKYGVMSEKRGEYKIDKQTGEWIYEPYETVVDTSKYEVVSSKDSQAIRNRQFDEGTGEPHSSTNWTEHWLNQVELPVFLTEKFKEAYYEQIRNRSKNTAYSITALANGVSFANIADYMNNADNSLWSSTSDLKVNSIVEGLQQSYSALTRLSDLYDQAVANGTDSYQGFLEAYEAIQEKATQWKEELSKLAEENTERYKNQMNIAMAYMDKMFATFSEKLQKIELQINLLNEWEIEDKLELNWEQINAQRNNWLTIQDKKDQQQIGLNKNLSDLYTILNSEIGQGLQRQISSTLKDLVNADGTINQETLNEIKQVLNAYLKSQGDNISTEVTNALIKSEELLNNIAQDATEVAKYQEQIQQERQTLQQYINEALETYKNAVNTAYEQRKSLYQAVIDNSSTLKELVEKAGQLLKDTDYIGKATNMVENYNSSVQNIRDYRTNDERLRTELFDISAWLGSKGIDVASGYNASGELISGSELARLVEELTEKIQQAQVKGNDKVAANLMQQLTAIESYGTILTEKNENQEALQGAIVNTLEIQKQLIEQGKTYLTQYMEEMVSQYKAATDTNGLIGDRLSAIQEALGKFDREQQLSVLNSKLQNNQNETINLIKQQTSVTQERDNLISEMENAIPDIKVDSLFTDKGEVNSALYNEAKQLADQLLENNKISEEDYIAWQQRVEQVGELKKNELELEEQIIDNYQTETQMLEEKNKLIAEGYEWQISKMGSLLELTNKRFETENKIFELRADLDKELRSAKQQTQWLTKSERLKIFNEEDYAQLYQAINKMESEAQSYYEDYYAQMMNLTEDTLYEQEYITAEYERRMALVEAEYDLTQKRVDLEKEQLKLKNVASEKSERMYINGEWRQVANTEELISAAETVADKEKEYELAQQERAQKIQENQMNEYIDGLKRIQSAIENSTNKTGKTEEELINRLTQTIETLVGADGTGGSLKKIVDNLAVDLSNYEQVTKTIINVELKEAVEELSKVTNSLQSEINKQKNVLEEDIGFVSSSLTDFRKELNEVDTITLIDDLSDLSQAIKQCINNLFTYTSKELENFEVTDKKYYSEAFSAVNNIVWLKRNYENAEKLYNNAMAINDTATAQQAEAAMAWATTEAEKYRQQLRDWGYSDLANQLEKDSLNYEEANKIREAMLNSIEGYEKQLQKGVTNVSNDLKTAIGDLNLNEDLENQVMTIMDRLNVEQSKQFIEELKLEKTSSLEVINKWSQEAEKANTSSLIAANQFLRSGEVFTASVDLANNTATIISDSGEEFQVSIDEFGGIVGEIPKKFEGVVEQLRSAIIEAKNQATQTQKPDNTTTTTSTPGGGGGGGGGGYSSRNSDGTVGVSYTPPSSVSQSTTTVENSTVNGIKTQTVTDSQGNSHTYVYRNGQWMSNNGTVPENSASGTLSTEESLYNIDEIGKEIVIPSGRLRMMEYGDQVIPHNISENLLKWGALNPALLRGLTPELTNNITNNKTTKVNIENVNLENVTNGNNFMPELNRYLQRTNTLA